MQATHCCFSVQRAAVCNYLSHTLKVLTVYGVWGWDWSTWLAEMFGLIGVCVALEAGMKMSNAIKVYLCFRKWFCASKWIFWINKCLCANFKNNELFILIL